MPCHTQASLTIAQITPGSNNSARAGTQALRLVSTPLNAQVLQVLAEGPRSLIDLRREAGSPPQTTMRGHLRKLSETGVVVRRRQNDFPGSLDLELTPVGRELGVVARTLGAWLRTAPEGPLPLGGSAAKNAVKALVEGWGTRMIRALAARPLTLTELNGLISGLSYPSLERRLGAMRLAGQVERAAGQGRGTPYTVTDWLRRAIAPLAAAASWERRYAATQTVPVRRLDAEAAFLLAIPLLHLPEELSGRCRLTVEVGSTNGERLAGVLITVQEGRIVSCLPSLKGHADAWTSGSVGTWLSAVMEGDAGRLEVGGDCDLARALMGGLHATLFEATTVVEGPERGPVRLN
jgi:DNA-binding HxlR family transcriptional regulator